MLKISTIVFFICSYISFGQLFSEFKAREAITASTNLAASVLESPVLIGIGAANIQKIDPTVTLEISFNVQNGNSRLWLYTFMDANDNSRTTNIPLIKTFGNFIDARAFTGDIDVDVDFPLVALDESFADSDVFVTNLKASSEYTAMVSKHSDTDYEIVGLTTAEYEDGSYGDPTWLIIYTDDNNESRFYCEMNGVSGESYCEETTNSFEVNYTLNSELKVYPQPANDEIIVTLKESYNNIKIVDVLGNEINANAQYLLNNDLLNVDISSLETGVYFIILENSSKKDVVRFIKN